jgi:hypothetical protein
MSRLPHISWNALAVLSALLCMANTGLWLFAELYFTSLRRVAPLQMPGGRELLYQPVVIWSGEGVLQIAYQAPRIPNLPQAHRPHWEIASHRYDSFYDAPQFQEPLKYYRGVALGRYGIGRRGSGDTFQLRIVLPDWLLTLLAAILPVLAVWKRRRQLKALQSGCCLACGYDMRATPSRCPECGVARGE